MRFVAAEIDWRYRPEPGEPVLVTRLQDGTEHAGR
jgi:hypothetical protein